MKKPRVGNIADLEEQELAAAAQKLQKTINRSLDETLMLALRGEESLVKKLELGTINEDGEDR